MLITLYKSALCPRCHRARKQIREIVKDNPDFELTEVDILSSPRLSLDAGIRMIPAIKIEDDILSAVFLEKKTIAEFITRHKK